MESFDDGGLVTASNGSRDKGLVWYPWKKGNGWILNPWFCVNLRFFERLVQLFIDEYVLQTAEWVTERGYELVVWIGDPRYVGTVAVKWMTRPDAEAFRTRDKRTETRKTWKCSNWSPSSKERQQQLRLKRLKRLTRSYYKEWSRASKGYRWDDLSQSKGIRSRELDLVFEVRTNLVKSQEQGWT